MNKSDHFGKSRIKQIKNCLICDYPFPFLRRFFSFLSYENYNFCKNKNCNAIHIYRQFYGEKYYVLKSITFWINHKTLISISNDRKDILVSKNNSYTYIVNLPVDYINRFPIKNIDKFISMISLLK